MWFIVHAAVGGALGSRLGKRLWLALIVAFLSHALIDLIPHWDYVGGLFDIHVYGALDVLGGLVVLFLMQRNSGRSAACILGGLAAALPDLDYLLNELGVFSHWYYISHLDFFPHGRAPVVPGVLIQALIVVASFVVAVRKRA